MQNTDERGPRVVVVIVDGLPLDLAESTIPQLPFLGSRLSHQTRAVSCFPSTTGPARPALRSRRGDGHRTSPDWR